MSDEPVTSTDQPVRSRPLGPTLSVLSDLVGQARHGGTWMVLVIVALIVAAVAAAWFGQTVLPWVIYPAL